MTLTIDPEAFGTDREAVRLALAEENIDARPVLCGSRGLRRTEKALAAGVPRWGGRLRTAEYEAVGGEVAEDLFTRGLCLPSGSNLTEEDLRRVVTVIRRVGRLGDGTEANDLANLDVEAKIKSRLALRIIMAGEDKPDD